MSDSSFKGLTRYCVSVLGFCLSMWIIREMADIFIQLDIAEYINSNGVEPTLEVTGSRNTKWLSGGGNMVGLTSPNKIGYKIAPSAKVLDIQNEL